MTPVIVEINLNEFYAHEHPEDPCNYAWTPMTLFRHPKGRPLPRIGESIKLHEGGPNEPTYELFGVTLRIVDVLHDQGCQIRLRVVTVDATGRPNPQFSNHIQHYLKRRAKWDTSVQPGA